jgi:excisionase family DNA binding protein
MMRSGAGYDKTMSPALRENIAETRGPAAFPMAVRVREACRLTGIGRSKLYELIAGGDIEVIKVGAITLIPTRSLRRFLERRSRINE